MSQPEKHSNALRHESSPYLLQHAHNPVNWHAWKPEVLAMAKEQNKLILVSIGYSACHWCHVMEHECFEDEAVAAVMNAHFINIKVDREERPDIDMVYMSAVQLMTGQGGWPLNCFTLPDGRPIYGGTYFPKQQWLTILQNLADLYRDNPSKVEEYAAQLTEGMDRMDLLKFQEEGPEISFEIVRKGVENWKKFFDPEEGGPSRAPKFPLPNNYRFLLKYAAISGDEAVHQHLRLTLAKMAQGGIYDQLGGGFARYSVDALWKIPHFEKMLYDNAQLISLYSEAYRYEKNEWYRSVVYESIAFVQRELASEEGYFYSALDADSEGEEGKYYVWTKEELETVLEEDFALFAECYHIDETGYWEHDNYVLMRAGDWGSIALRHQLTMEVLQTRMAVCKDRLLKIRHQRIRPGLDDKTLTSWNGLMCKALCDAWLAFGEAEFRTLALRSGMFISTHLMQPNHSLYHSYKNGKVSVQGFLEDYAFVIEAFLGLYTISGQDAWLKQAHQLMEYALVHFYEEGSGMFYFTSNTDEALVVRKMELSDNVIPASNSQMAINLFELSKHFELPGYETKARRMAGLVKEEYMHYAAGYSNWGHLMLSLVEPFFEVVIVGNSVDEKLREFTTHYLPNLIFARTEAASHLPLLQQRYVAGKTMIYVCRDRSCRLPVEEVEAALKQLR